MCECVIVNDMYHEVKVYVCVSEREEGHPPDTLILSSHTL